MSAPGGNNKFTFDVVATDNASATIGKIADSVNLLVPALKAAAAAYEQMAKAQKKAGVDSSIAGWREGSRALQQQAADQRAAAKEQRAASKQARADSDSRATRIASLVEAEAKASRDAAQAVERRTASENRASIASQGATASRIKGYEAEIQRSQKVVDSYAQQAEAARKARAEADREAGITRKPNGQTRTVGTDDKALLAASGLAARQYTEALNRLKAAKADVNLASTAMKTGLREQATALKAASTEVERATASLQRLQQANQTTSGSLNTTRYALYQVAAAYGSIAAVAKTAVSEVISTAISFQTAFSQVSRTSGLGIEIKKGSEEARVELAKLRADLIQLSVDLPVSFENLSAIGALGAQLGIASSDISEFTRVVALFTAQSNVSAEEAATYFGRLQNILNVPTQKFENLGSAVVELGVNSVATESEILAVTTQIGGMANNAGFSTPYVLGLGTALASLRVPPELARGTTTRLFQIISRAAADGGDRIANFGAVIGETGKAAGDLFAQNPDQFFTRFITGLGKASENGQNLIPILDGLGIKASRDVPVVTRLANSYQLLGKYTTEAAASFQAGTYLDAGFGAIQDNAAIALQKLANSFDALKDAAGQKFLEPIRIAANLLNGLFQALTSFAGGGFGVFAVSAVAAIGVLFAFRAATALVSAALFAMTTATRGLGVDQLRSYQILKAVRTKLAEHAVTTKAAAAATDQLALAELRLAEATAAAALASGTASAALVRQTAVTAANITAAIGAGAANTGAAVGIATIAPASTAAVGGLARLRGAFAALNTTLGPVGWLFLGISAVVGVVSAFSSSSDEAAVATEELKQKQDALNASWLASLGGAEALNKAVAADTETYRKVGEAGAKAAGITQTYSKAILESKDGTKFLTTTVKDLTTGLESQSSEVVKTADGQKALSATAAAALGQMDPLAGGVDNVTVALDEQTKALGNNVLALTAKANYDQIMSTFNTKELQDSLLSLNTTADPNRLSTIVQTMIGPDGPEGVKRELASVIAASQAQIDAFNAEIEKRTALINPRTGAGLDEIAAVKKQRDEVQKTLDTYNLLITKSGELKTALNSSLTAGTFQGVVGEALNMADGLDEATDAATKTEDTLKKAATAYKELAAAAFSSREANGALIDSFESLGESIATNGTDFSASTDAGRANLEALKSTLAAFADTQTTAIETGALSAKDAADQMASFIKNTITELGNQQVDVSQLDFLAQYAADLANKPYTMIVNTDTSAAISNLTNLVNYAAQARAAIMSAIGVTEAKVGNVNPQKYNSLSTQPGPKAPAQVKAPQLNQALNGALATARQTAAAKDLEKSQKEAGKAGKAAGKDAADASKDAAEASKKQLEYVKDLADFYSKLATNAFAAITAEGKAFESLQKLGQGLVDNGKSFNTVTDNGRKNFSALAGTLDAFGETLSSKIESGVLSADQASAKYKEFAKGIYGELVSLGVPAEQIDGFFKALGVSADGWTGNSGDVQQYAGFIGAAADAAGGLSKELDAAKEYADALGTALRKVYDQTYGLSNAVDSVQSSVNDLRDAYQQSIDKVDELRRSNASLAADLSTAQVDKAQAEIEKAISERYGETARAADYAAQSQTAQSKIDDISANIAANSKEAAAIEEGRNQLEGYSAAAIENRKALQSLQSQMVDQITAYAATGKSTQEVEAYTADLQAQFISTAQAAGYTATQVQGYIVVFNNLAGVIRSVPNSLNITATADTGQAISALNAIPRGSSFVTTATIQQAQYDNTVYYLRAIPTRGDYLVVPRVDQGSLGAAQGQLGGLQGQLVAPVKVRVNVDEMNKFIKTLNLPVAQQTSAFALWDAVRAYGSSGGVFNNGNLTNSFATGGIVPGPAPANKSKDNVLAMLPNGTPVGLQGQEGILNHKAMKMLGPEFVHAVNNVRGFAGGGMLGGGGSGGVLMVELSPVDRKLLEVVASKNVVLQSDGQILATAVGKGNTSLNNRGSN